MKDQPNSQSLSLPNLLLRAEGLALFIATLIVYGTVGGDWLAFVVLLFAPDLSMLGYLVNVHIGSIVYNVVHTYALALVLLALAWALSAPVLLSLALILIAHISLDRTLGYGLKYPTVFKDTHLQRV